MPDALLTFMNDYPWLSILTSDKLSNFGSCRKLGHHIFSLFLSMLIDIMYFGEVETPDEQEEEEESILDISEICTAAVITVCITMPLFRVIDFLLARIHRMNYTKQDYSQLNVNEDLLVEIRYI